MILTRRVTWVGFVLASAVLAWNVATPANPDHMLNLVIGTILTLGMVLCLFLPALVVKVIHSLALAGASFVYVSTGDGFFFSGTLTVTFFVLIHAYGAFRSHALWKLPLSILLVYVLSAISSAHFTTPSAEAFGRAALWTLMVIGFLVVLWYALEEFRRQFHEDFASDLIKQNRQLLELNKQLIGGCKDGNPA